MYMCIQCMYMYNENVHVMYIYILHVHVLTNFLIPIKCNQYVAYLYIFGRSLDWGLETFG